MIIKPTQAGFIAFIRNVMGINSLILPNDAPVIELAFCVALEITNTILALASSRIYALAVYNLAGDNLINYAQDAEGALVYKDGLPFFAYTRKQFDSAGFIPGVVQSTSDESTSSSFVVQEAAQNFTLGNLQNLKTPYGRQYLAFAQDYGPTIWGLS